MNEEILTDALLREFLLGKVDDEEVARIESLFLTDSEARERVLVIEQELIEDYLENSLTAKTESSSYCGMDKQRHNCSNSESLRR